MYWGVANHQLGLAAAALGQADQAHALLAIACDQHQAMGAEPWAQRSADALAQLDRAPLDRP